jgi:large subunit ribosomal protein L35Ae
VNILPEKTTGRITNYRTGPKSQTTNQCLIEFNHMNSGAAGQLVGKKVVWNNGKDKFTGKILGLHGRNGMVRVKFARPVPGQAIGSVVELIR